MRWRSCSAPSRSATRSRISTIRVPSPARTSACSSRPGGPSGSLVRLTRRRWPRAKTGWPRSSNEASAAAADLEAAQAERRSYLADLQSQRQLNEAEISSLEQQAHAAQKRSNAIAAQQAIAPAPAPPLPRLRSPPVSGHGRALTVVATAYALPGTTATGLPVGPGIVAVDPTRHPVRHAHDDSRIRRGRRRGHRLARSSARESTSGSRREAQADQWGVKTITIYLH